MSYPYVAPALVWSNYEFEPVVIPEDQQYWGVRVERHLNVPVPKVDNHTGPHGRLKWINPLPMHWHDFSPSHEQSENCKEVRLHKKGWVGLCTSFIGPFEERAIKRYVDALGDDVYKMRPYTMECHDERPGDIGGFEEKCRSFYFRTKEIRDGFIAMLEAIPPRTAEMYVDHRRMDAKCKLVLRGYNWHVFKGEDADLLTIEESVPSTALMVIRLSAGVAKPT